MPVLANVSVGCVSTAKKSSLRRCLSRSGVPVSMLEACTSKRTVDVVGASALKSMAPPKSVNRPRTFVRRWRTWKVASEWVLSMAKVRTAAAVVMFVSSKFIRSCDVKRDNTY